MLIDERYVVVKKGYYWERKREKNCLPDGLLFRKKLVYEVDGGST